jgi:hypothetical protein
VVSPTGIGMILPDRRISQVRRFCVRGRAYLEDSMGNPIVHRVTHQCYNQSSLCAHKCTSSRPSRLRFRPRASGHHPGQAHLAGVRLFGVGVPRDRRAAEGQGVSEQAAAVGGAGLAVATPRRSSSARLRVIASLLSGMMSDVMWGILRPGSLAR